MTRKTFEVLFESVEPERRTGDGGWRPAVQHRGRMVVIADSKREAGQYVRDASEFPVDRIVKINPDPGMPDPEIPSWLVPVSDRLS